MVKTSGHVFVLTGPSGTGKSSILYYMEEALGAETVPKYTTRPSRNTKEDQRDFIFCKLPDLPKQGLLRFDSYGHAFGIRLDSIESTLHRGRIHAIVVGDYGAVRQLASMYRDQLSTIFVFCESSILKARMLKDPSSQRLDRWLLVQEEIGAIYNQLDCVNLVVDNSGSPDDTFLQVRKIVSPFIES
jgi:ribose 1,5-bisphosphokinase PhnN